MGIRSLIQSSGPTGTDANGGLGVFGTILPELNEGGWDQGEMKVNKAHLDIQPVH